MPNTIIEPDNITPPPHYREGEPPQIITSDTARQGPKGRRGLVILIASLVTIGIAWAIIEAVFRHAT
ncbi:MAG TPA: hypothetical protein VII20_21030 [Roseiarcus sp.]|jgi:hypothetical protein